MKNFIKQYPLISFVTLSYILGAIISYLVIGGYIPSGLIILAATSASLSALIIVAIAEGKIGVKKLLGQLLVWRVGIKWWFLVLFFLVPTTLIGFFITGVVIGSPLNPVNFMPIIAIIPMMLVYFVMAGLGEEIGWRGFMLPRLQAKYSAFISSLIIAVIWGVWHFPLFLYKFPGAEHMVYSDWTAKYGIVVALFFFILFNQLPWAILYTWVYNNTKGSLLLICILHGSEPWVAIFTKGFDTATMFNWTGYGVVMLICAIAVVLYNGPKNLSRTNERIIIKEDMLDIS
ncbi:type II CAAX prenyl endopeptidase Rce1 family protein [Candidatus Margulisiibacteriota bacterium]